MCSMTENCRRRPNYIDAVESTIIDLVQWLRLAVEATGACVATARKLRRGPADAGTLSGTRD